MKKSALLIGLLCLLVSCTVYEPSSPITSPDGKGMAVLSFKKTTDVPMPGPEPPRTKERWTRLTVWRTGAVVYDTGFEKVGVYQTGLGTYDLLWSSDSSFLAYRMLNTFRIIAMDGKVTSFNIIKDNALISSFKWIGNKEILVVSKGVDEPLGMYGDPVHYHGYLAKATYVKVSKIHLDTGVIERFRLQINHPTFIFHSLGFVVDEISPYSSRVAFSDGENINVFDDESGKVIATAPVNGTIQGIWWSDNNTVILGLGLLSKPELKFAVFNISDCTVEDVTKKLLPFWDHRSYSQSNWFRPGLE